MQLASFDALYYTHGGGQLQEKVDPELKLDAPGVIPFILSMDISAPRSTETLAYYNAWYYPEKRQITMYQDAWDAIWGGDTGAYYCYMDLNDAQVAYLDSVLTVRTDPSVK